MILFQALLFFFFFWRESKGKWDWGGGIISDIYKILNIIIFRIEMDSSNTFKPTVWPKLVIGWKSHDLNRWKKYLNISNRETTDSIVLGLFLPLLVIQQIIQSYLFSIKLIKIIQITTRNEIFYKYLISALYFQPLEQCLV